MRRERWELRSTSRSASRTASATSSGVRRSDPPRPRRRPTGTSPPRGAHRLPSDRHLRRTPHHHGRTRCPGAGRRESRHRPVHRWLPADPEVLVQLGLRPRPQPLRTLPTGSHRRSARRVATHSPRAAPTTPARHGRDVPAAGSRLTPHPGDHDAQQPLRRDPPEPARPRTARPGGARRRCRRHHRRAPTRAPRPHPARNRRADRRPRRNPTPSCSETAAIPTSRTSPSRSAPIWGRSRRASRPTSGWSRFRCWSRARHADGWPQHLGRTGDHTEESRLWLQEPGISPRLTAALGQASVCDVAPTALRLLGVDIPDGIDGQPLVPLADA